MIFYEPEDPDKKNRWFSFQNLVLWWGMFVGLAGIGIFGLLILGPPISALANLGCQGHSARNATVDATGARLLRVISDRGDLNVNGRAGLSEVRVEGSACANHSERDQVAFITLSAVREDDEITVTVDLPGGTRTGRLDLSIDVPADLPLVEIEDSLGPVIVTNIRDLHADVGNGGLDANAIAGNVDVPNLRGSATLEEIGGDVSLEQIRGRAGIEIRDVRGDVFIGLNRNGPASITDVRGDVTVASAGFGDLDVARVVGDLVVRDNLRGEISHREIGGRVILPGGQDPGS